MLCSLRHLAAVALLAGSPVWAQPLSQSFRIDFFRDVPSRNLQGLATRSDGRLIAGPVLQELRGDAGADLLWGMVPDGPSAWLVGTGPDGRILRLTPNFAERTLTSAPYAQLDDGHVYALRRLPDGALLAGTSPRGGLYLLRDGKTVAGLRLPADSIFDVLVVNEREALVGTGNPGRVYRVILTTFAASGVHPEVVSDPVALASRGVERVGEIRDRNVRRLALAADGRILAGSAPSGNLYAFPAAGGAPELLFDNTRAEVTDLRVEPNGDIYALVVFSSTPGAGPARLGRMAPSAPSGPAEPSSDSSTTAPVPLPTDDTGEPPPVEKFTGRSALVWLPGGTGFPETLAARSNIALYRMAPRGDLLVMAGGDAGEIVGFDRKLRRSLTFGGSSSAQLSDLAALGADRFLLLRNNPAGLAVLDFAAKGDRRAETRRLDLRSPSTLGALRFDRLRGVEPAQLQVTLRSNRADDEFEGWTPWKPATLRNGGWLAEDLQGRFARVRIELPGTAGADVELDAARLFHLPQNRRPTLQAFHVLTPHVALLPRPEPSSAQLLTLGQVISPNNDTGASSNERRAALLGSQLIPQPGSQVVYWNIDDADGDEFVATFSIRRDGTDDWTDLAVNTTESWVQFDRSHLPDGVYFTRLTVSEQAPRDQKERLTTQFETDDLLIDSTPPAIESVQVRRQDGKVVVSVTGRDALSLLAGVELQFNNGVRWTVEQPDDGVLDSVHETFTAEIPAAEVSGATAVELVLHDDTGNTAARRLPLPAK